MNEELIDCLTLLEKLMDQEIAGVFYDLKHTFLIIAKLFPFLLQKKNFVILFVCFYLIANSDIVPFNTPVDYKALNLLDYPAVVKKPCDLGTIKVYLFYYRLNSNFNSFFPPLPQFDRSFFDMT